MFPTDKSGRELSRKIWDMKFPVSRVLKFSVFEISRYPGNLCRDRGKFFYISKDFRGRPTDIYHSDLKIALVQIKTFFCLLKIFFPKFANFFMTKRL